MANVKKVEKKSDDRSKRQEDAAENRWQVFDVSRLLAIAEDLGELQGLVQGQANAMKDKGIESVNVDGATKPDSGFEMYSSFVANLNAAVTKAKLDARQKPT